MTEYLKIEALGALPDGTQQELENFLGQFALEKFVVEESPELALLAEITDQEDFIFERHYGAYASLFLQPNRPILTAFSHVINPQRLIRAGKPNPRRGISVMKGGISTAGELGLVVQDDSETEERGVQLSSLETALGDISGISGTLNPNTHTITAQQHEALYKFTHYLLAKINDSTPST
ncbi:MAG: hypothetical protein ACXWLH_02305 [Candidatus Saccharimonadales bacterium]